MPMIMMIIIVVLIAVTIVLATIKKGLGRVAVKVIVKGKVNGSKG